MATKNAAVTMAALLLGAWLSGGCGASRRDPGGHAIDAGTSDGAAGIPDGGAVGDGQAGFDGAPSPDGAVPIRDGGSGIGRWEPVAAYPDDIRIGSQRTVLLADGTALVIASAYTLRYEPTVDRWTQKASMAVGRGGYTAERLSDGTVLVVGGRYGDARALVTTERYDPIADVWHPAADLPEPRSWHASTVLDDGRVVVAGGGGDCLGCVISSVVLLWDTDHWSRLTDSTGAFGHGAILALGSGRVLLTGGGWEIYDPSGAAGAGATIDTRSAREGRRYYALVKLLDGSALAIGGQSLGSNNAIDHVERFDPVTLVAEVKAPLLSARRHHVAATLLDGRVLVVGGADNDGAIETAELYDPTADGWTAMPGPALQVGMDATATRLTDGSVLVVTSDGAMRYVP